MKQYTVIKTKHGNALLLSQSDDDNANLLRFPYLGFRPEGTTLDESDVREVRLFKDNGEWVETSYENYMEDDELGFPVCIAYVDAEPHDRHIRSALPLLNLCADEMRAVEYWKRRCEAAEKLVGMEPSDPKTYDEFCRLRGEWEKLVKQEQDEK